MVFQTKKCLFIHRKLSYFYTCCGEEKKNVQNFHEANVLRSNINLNKLHGVMLAKEFFLRKF